MKAVHGSRNPIPIGIAGARGARARRSPSRSSPTTCRSSAAAPPTRAEFSEAAGLRPGNEVRIAGVKVGEVSDVELERRPGGRRLPGQGRLGRRPDARRPSRSRPCSARSTSRSTPTAATCSSPDDPIPREPHARAVRRARGVQRARRDRRRRSTPTSSRRASRSSPRRSRHARRRAGRARPACPRCRRRSPRATSSCAAAGEHPARSARRSPTATRSSQKLLADGNLLLGELQHAPRRDRHAADRHARRSPSELPGPGRRQQRAARAGAGRARPGHHACCSATRTTSSAGLQAHGAVRAGCSTTPSATAAGSTATSAGCCRRRPTSASRRQPGGLPDTARVPGGWPMSTATRLGRDLARGGRRIAVRAGAAGRRRAVVGAASARNRRRGSPRTSTGASALYEGNDVRVLGVRVGHVDEVEPQGDRCGSTCSSTDGVEIPADAQAVVVAPSLVSDRYVQLTPAYTGGPAMAERHGDPARAHRDPGRAGRPVREPQRAQRPRSARTAPTRTARCRTCSTPLAANLDGNGEALNETIKQLRPDWPDAVRTARGPVRHRRQPAEVHRRRSPTSDDAGPRRSTSRLADVSRLPRRRARRPRRRAAAAGHRARRRAAVHRRQPRALKSNVDKLTGGDAGAGRPAGGARRDARRRAARAVEHPQHLRRVVRHRSTPARDLNELTQPPVVTGLQPGPAGHAERAAADRSPTPCDQLAPLLDGALPLPTLGRGARPRCRQGKLPPLPLPLVDLAGVHGRWQLSAHASCCVGRSPRSLVLRPAAARSPASTTCRCPAARTSATTRTR